MLLNIFDRKFPITYRIKSHKTSDFRFLVAVQFEKILIKGRHEIFFNKTKLLKEKEIFNNWPTDG